MKLILILFICSFLYACGSGDSGSTEEKVIEITSDAAAMEVINAANQSAADALAKAEAEKLIRFGTGKFGQSTFQ